MADAAPHAAGVFIMADRLASGRWHLLLLLSLQPRQHFGAAAEQADTNRQTVKATAGDWQQVMVSISKPSGNS